MDYEIIHTTPGRLRIRVPQLAIDSEYKSQLAWYLHSLNCVKKVRINATAGSVVINYDPKLVSDATVREKVFRLIQQASSEKIPQAYLLLER
jgi:hypothetical protein